MIKSLTFIVISILIITTIPQVSATNFNIIEIEFDKHPINTEQKSLMTITISNVSLSSATIAINIITDDFEIFPSSNMTETVPGRENFLSRFVEKDFTFALTPLNTGSIPILIELLEDGNRVEHETLLFEVLETGVTISQEPWKVLEEKRADVIPQKGYLDDLLTKIVDNSIPIILGAIVSVIVGKLLVRKQHKEQKVAE